MKGQKSQTYGLIVVMAVFIMVCGIFIYNYPDGKVAPEFIRWRHPEAASGTIDTNEDLSQEELPEEEVLPNPTATILAVGDIMMHDGQIWAGYDEKTDTFDYSEFFHVVKDEITAADIAMADLETTLGGKEQKYTGYPMFNSPDELADALKNAGFDIIVTSNNHSLDRGAKGALRTIQVLKERGLASLGTYESEEEREQILIKEANGIKIAFLSYTYGTNGIPIPKDKQYIVNLIDEELILCDLKKAQSQADAVVVYLHFGEEYQRTPSKAQRKLAHLILKNGASFIAASHPHVIQPGEWMEVEEPNGEIIKKYTSYSMGNFISAQRFPYTEEGLMVKFTLEKDLKKNKVYLTDVREIDTWVDKFVRDGKMRYVVRYGKKP
ncbi:MAG TPA: CapA family protein [Thermoanaerobacterales bacterium]|nr:CapA family protein [Thermoanaerobacterales bacterium]